MVSVVSKVCSKCDIEKHINQFHKNQTRFRPDCKECVAKYSKDYRHINRKIINDKKHKYHKLNPNVKRRSYLKLEYGITMEDYDTLLNQQDFKCAICKSKNVKNSQHKNLHIDHCHKTGKIRGLLCGQCNTALGQLEDNVDLFKEAIRYLTSK